MAVNDSTAPVDFLTPAATPPSGNVAENTPQAVSSHNTNLRYFKNTEL